MLERRTCSFCGNEIEPGTGKMYIKKDGTIFFFCKSKCQKNLLKLRRLPHRTEWTSRYAEMKAVRVTPQRKKVARKKRKADEKPIKEAKKPSKGRRGKPPLRKKK